MERPRSRVRRRRTYGLLLETNLDGKVSEAKANVTALALEATLGEAMEKDTSPGYDADEDSLEAQTLARAALVTNYFAHADHGFAKIITELGDNLTAIGNVPGTNGAALASAWTSALATILGNFSSTIIGYLNNAQLGNVPNLSTLTTARIAYLDNIDASILELFYEHFGGNIDDIAGIVVTGTIENGPASNLIDNNTTTTVKFNTVGQYVEMTFPAMVHIKKIRIFGSTLSHVDHRYKFQAYVGGAWVDKLLNIVDSDTASWGSWLDITPATAIKWRMVHQVKEAGSGGYVGELEMDGVSVG